MSRILMLSLAGCLAGTATLMPSSASAVLPPSPPQIELCVEVPDDAPPGVEVQVAAVGPHDNFVETFGPGDHCRGPFGVTEAGEFEISASVVKTGCPDLNTGTSCHVIKFRRFQVKREIGGKEQLIDHPEAETFVTIKVGQTRATADFVKA